DRDRPPRLVPRLGWGQRLDDGLGGRSGPPGRCPDRRGDPRGTAGPRGGRHGRGRTRGGHHAARGQAREGRESGRLPRAARRDRHARGDVRGLDGGFAGIPPQTGGALRPRRLLRAAPGLGAGHGGHRAGPAARAGLPRRVRGPRIGTGRVWRCAVNPGVPAPPPTLCGRQVPADRPLVMAIVNRTPDSFYDRGATFSDDAAMRRVDEAVADGADILDIGGVKAGPGDAVDAGEETRRVVPFVEAVRARHPDALLSVDTWRGDVARRALSAGADLVNDTWAGHDPEVLTAAADAGAGFVCSHTGGAVPRTRPFRVGYEDVVADVVAELSAGAERALAAGVPRDGILVDPTHDFGKNTFHGLELVRRTDRIVALGHPVLM